MVISSPPPLTSPIRVEDLVPEGEEVAGSRCKESPQATQVPSTLAKSQEDEEDAPIIKKEIKDQDQEEASKTRLDDLKDEILMLIFAKLNTVDRYRGELVSKRWNRVIRRDWLSEKRLTDLDRIFFLYREPKFTLPFFTRLLGKCPNLRTLSLEGVTELLGAKALEVIADSCPLLEVINLRGLSSITDDGLRLLGERCPHLRELCLKDAHQITDEGIRTFLEVANSAASQTSLAKGFESLDLYNCTSRQYMFPNILSSCPRGLKRLRVTGMAAPGFRSNSSLNASALIRELINLRSQEENLAAQHGENVAFPLTHLSLDGLKSDTLSLVADHFADTLIELDLTRGCVRYDDALLIHGIEKVERIKSLQVLRLTCPPLVGLTNSTLKQILLTLLSLRELVISCDIPASQPVPLDLAGFLQIGAHPQGQPIPVMDEQEPQLDQVPVGDAPAEPEEEAPEVIGDEGVAPISLGLCSPFLEVISLPKSQVSGAALRQFTWLEHLRELSFAGSSQLDDASLIAFFQETASISTFSQFELKDCFSLTGNGVWGALEAFRARAPPECKDRLVLLWNYGRIISHRETTREDVASLERGYDHYDDRDDWEDSDDSSAFGHNAGDKGRDWEDRSTYDSDDERWRNYDI